MRSEVDPERSEDVGVELEADDFVALFCVDCERVADDASTLERDDVADAEPGVKEEKDDGLEIRFVVEVSARGHGTHFSRSKWESLPGSSVAVWKSHGVLMHDSALDGEVERVVEKALLEFKAAWGNEAAVDAVYRVTAYVRERGNSQRVEIVHGLYPRLRQKL